jgi:hypothetical protein
MDFRTINNFAYLRMWRTYTAELIIALNAVLDPKYMHPRSPTITATILGLFP